MGVRRRPLEQPPQPPSRCMGGGRRPSARPPMSRRPTRRRRTMISYSGQKFPVPATEIPCFRMEQGIYKLLNPLGDRLPKPPQEARIGRNFQNFPVIFPVLRECAAVSRFRHPLPSRRLTDVRSLDIGRGEFIMTRLSIREHDEYVGFSCLLCRRRSHRDRRCRVAAKVPGTCSGCLHDGRRPHLEVIPVDQNGSGHKLARD